MCYFMFFLSQPNTTNEKSKSYVKKAYNAILFEYCCRTVWRTNISNLIYCLFVQEYKLLLWYWVVVVLFCVLYVSFPLIIAYVTETGACVNFQICLKSKYNKGPFHYFFTQPIYVCTVLTKESKAINNKIAWVMVWGE